MKIIIILSSTLIAIGASAQYLPESDSSTKLLEGVIVTSYSNNIKLIDVSAPVAFVTPRMVSLFDNTSVLSAINTQPGVRMEERSPGSYRLNIRGSSLRSPFGVRNVKVYYNGIPFTDPGGNTYFNQLGFYSFHSIEIIKGPAGSMYGAGTGGAMIINSNDPLQPRFTAAFTGGSYHQNSMNGSITFGKEDLKNAISYQHQSGNGYRDHTEMYRDVVSWDATLKKTTTGQIQSHFFYSNLYYQTPGGLNQNEYNANPRSARPHAGTFPSADEAQAAFFAKTFFAGVSMEQKINAAWKNTTAVYGAYSQNRNPNFRNFSATSEPHFGGRTNFQFIKKEEKVLFTINTGAEFQQSFNSQRVYNNNGGTSGAVQTDDDIFNTQGFIFLQANAIWNNGWSLTLGTSVNESTLNFKRYSTSPPDEEKRNFKNQIAPRIAVLKKINDHIRLYTSVSRGFSPPSTGEVLPSTNFFNKTLQAESGIDYEVGAKAAFLQNRLYIDINLFFYQLQNAIVQKRDISGGDYFENAGAARENGVETFISYQLLQSGRHFINDGQIYLSDTWNNFKYKNFKQVSVDYSGNEIPGVAKHTIAGGVDVSTKVGLYANANLFYSSRIYLNDANTAVASPYTLLGFKTGYKFDIHRKTSIDFFIGVQNILNEKYSLGNDINAAGGRYFNTAPGTNYYGGIILQLK